MNVISPDRLTLIVLAIMAFASPPSFSDTKKADKKELKAPKDNKEVIQITPQPPPNDRAGKIEPIPALPEKKKSDPRKSDMQKRINRLFENSEGKLGYP